MELKDCIIKINQLEPYLPDSHVGTVNRRIIGKETVGAEHLEIVLGYIEPSGKAEPHFHANSEQVIYLLEGQIEVEIQGETSLMEPGDAVYFPPGIKHRADVVGDKSAKCLVIYSPPIQSLNTGFS